MPEYVAREILSRPYTNILSKIEESTEEIGDTHDQIWKSLRPL